MPYNVSSWFIEESRKQVLSPVRKFYIGSEDYSSYVKSWPTIKRRWDDTKPSNVSINLSNDEQTFNYIINDPTNLENIATIQMGFTHPTSGDELVTYHQGKAGKARFKDTNCIMSIVNKFALLSDRVIGADDEPVTFTDSNYSPGELAWWICTSYGNLSSIESTSNPDINYALWEEWNDALMDDAVYVNARFTGLSATEALRKVARMTHSAVYEDNNKIVFNRFLSTDDSVESLTIGEQYETQIELDDRKILNRQFVKAGYSVESDFFEITVQDEITASVNTYGPREQTEEDKSLWYVNSGSALNLAQRKVNAEGTPFARLETRTGLRAMSIQIGDSLSVVDEFFQVDSVHPYTVQVQLNDPLAFWPMNETSGRTVHDVSGNDHNLTVVDSAITNQSPLIKDGGRSVFFPTADVANLTRNNVINFERDEPWTIGFQFRVFSTGNNFNLLDNVADTDFSHMQMTLVGSGNYQFQMQTNTEDSEERIKIITDNAYNDGLIHNGIITYNGSSNADGLRVYMDGDISSFTYTASEGSIGFTAKSAGDTVLTIGQASNGYMDQFHIHSGWIATQSEANEFYLNSLVGSGSDIERYHWKLNETEVASGDICFDDGPNLAHGIYVESWSSVAGLNADGGTAVRRLGSGPGQISMGHILKFDNSDSFTAEFTYVYSGSSVLYLIGNRDLNTFVPSWSIGTAFGGAGRIFLGKSGNGIIADTSSLFNDGLPHHTLVTYNGNSDISGLSYYDNGIPCSLTAVSNNLTLSMVSSYHFGVEIFGNSEQFTIDNIRVTSGTVLTNSEAFERYEIAVGSLDETDITVVSSIAGLVENFYRVVEQEINLETGEVRTVLDRSQVYNTGFHLDVSTLDGPDQLY